MIRDRPARRFCHRLENDPDLLRFAGQFVPQRIVTTGNAADYRSWAKQYPLDQNGIPQLYVVRADGQQLYGGVGSLPGDKLPTMLTAALVRAGRSFPDAQAKAMAETVASARRLLDQDDLLAAASSLTPLLKHGSPDELNTFAVWALEAEELYEKIRALTYQSVKAANRVLKDNDTEPPFEALLAIAEAQAIYRIFPKLKSQAVSLTRNDYEVRL